MANDPKKNESFFKHLSKHPIDTFFEIFVFLAFTPLYTKVTPWISIPLAFIQDIVILVIMLLLFNADSVHTGVRISLSAGGILGAILAIGIISQLIEFVYSNLTICIVGLLVFYIYVFATNKRPRFEWID